MERINRMKALFKQYYWSFKNAVNNEILVPRAVASGEMTVRPYLVITHRNHADVTPLAYTWRTIWTAELLLYSSVRGVMAFDEYSGQRLDDRRWKRALKARGGGMFIDRRNNSVKMWIHRSAHDKKCLWRRFILLHSFRVLEFYVEIGSGDESPGFITSPLCGDGGCNYASGLHITNGSITGIIDMAWVK